MFYDSISADTIARDKLSDAFEPQIPKVATIIFDLLTVTLFAA